MLPVFFPPFKYELGTNFNMDYSNRSNSLNYVLKFDWNERMEQK